MRVHINTAHFVIVALAAFSDGTGAQSFSTGATTVSMSSAGPALAVAHSLPPSPWVPADPADSLYRLARSALNDGDYARAAELFGRITERYPRSEHAGDSYYWRAFALYRAGGSDNLKEAVRALEVQGRRFPRAATRGDARTLATRIQGTLASTYGDARSAESVQRKVEAASTGCPSEDDDDDMRIAALNALLQMDAEQAVPILKKVLARRDECAVGLRRKAVFLLSQKNTSETADVLLGIAQNDPDREVRGQAVFWLSQVQDDRVIDMLDRLLKSSSDSYIKDKAIFALAEHRGGRGHAILREYAQRESEPTELREQAIFWIGQKGSAENADFLKRLFATVGSEELKEKVLFSLSQMRGAGNQRWLLDVALNENESEDIRKNALFWAGEAGAEMGELVSLYGRMTSRELKEQLIFVFSQRKDRAAVDKLMDIARNDPDRELRKKSIFWLSQSRDPRVAQFLLEVIDR